MMVGSPKVLNFKAFNKGLFFYGFAIGEPSTRHAPETRACLVLFCVVDLFLLNKNKMNLFEQNLYPI